MNSKKTALIALIATGVGATILAAFTTTPELITQLFVATAAILAAGIVLLILFCTPWLGSLHTRATTSYDLDGGGRHWPCRLFAPIGNWRPYAVSTRAWPWENAVKIVSPLIFDSIFLIRIQACADFGTGSVGVHAFACASDNLRLNSNNEGEHKK